VPCVGLRISGGRIEKNYRDSTIRIYELEPFTSYYIEMENSSFDNVAWQIHKPIISVTVNANQYRFIQVPIRVLGEVSGTVMLDSDSLRKGQGRVVLSFYRSDSTLFASTVTEEDGYFSFMGFPPGSYYVKVSTTQLEQIRMRAEPKILPFTINRSKEGDLADGLEFILYRKESADGHNEKP